MLLWLLPYFVGVFGNKIFYQLQAQLIQVMGWNSSIIFKCYLELLSKYYEYEKSQELRVHFSSMSTHIHIIIMTIILLEVEFPGFLKNIIQTVVHYILQEKSKL